jgi:prevent-host-death family protein
MAIMAMLEGLSVRSVNIATLKNRLSVYLKAVREGEELVVRDRNRPIARIVPLSGVDGMDADELALVASGQLRPPEGPLPESFWTMPAPKVSRRRVMAALAAVRGDRV